MSEMSADKDVAIIAQAIRDTGLLGCGCCVDSEDYDGDGCPADADGWTEHTYQGDCIHEVGRVTYIARAVTRALNACVFPRAEKDDPRGESWNWLECCEQQSIDGHLPTCDRGGDPWCL